MLNDVVLLLIRKFPGRASYTSSFFLSSLYGHEVVVLAVRVVMVMTKD